MATSASIATYRYDTWGNLTSNESIPNAIGWSSPYRDAAIHVLYCLSTPVYDPSLGRFLSRDPLGRVPLFFSDNPYVYAGNNPLSNVDPSGQRVTRASTSQARNAANWYAQQLRMYAQLGSVPKCDVRCEAQHVQGDAKAAEGAFEKAVTRLGVLTVIGSAAGSTLQSLKGTLLSKVVSGGMLGITADVAMAYAAFSWEASQSIEWFEHQGNVDAFFTTAILAIAAITLAAGFSVAMSTEVTVGYSDFVGAAMMLSFFGVEAAMQKAQQEQDQEYQRGAAH